MLFETFQPLLSDQQFSGSKMDRIIFNLHDVILVMTSFLCILLTFLYLITQQNSRQSTLLLCGFMLAHSLIALHELSYYGEQFRYMVLDLSPNLFFIGSFAYCVDAVLLYLFTKAAIYKDFSFNRRQLWHLIPLVVYVLYLVVDYYSLGIMSKKVAIWEWWVTSSWQFVIGELCIKLLRVVYVAYCLQLIAQYISLQKDQRDDLSVVDLTWLKTLIIVFVAVFSVDSVLSIVKVARLVEPIEIQFLSYLGVFIYYATFILLLSLLVYSIAKLPAVEQVLQAEEDEQKVEHEDVDPDCVEHIKR